MSLVFAGIVPHPPTLIEELAQTEESPLAQTKAAFEALEQDLYLAKPDILIVVSAYSGTFPDTFVVNSEPNFITNFEKFGDFSLSDTWQGATDFAATFHTHSNHSYVPVKLINTEVLDSGVSIPLHLIGNHLSHMQVLPVGFSNLDTDTHVGFGNLIREECMNSNKRVAVLVSGHMSGATGPATDAETYTNAVRSALSTCDFAAIQHIPETATTTSATSLHKGLLILSGILGEGKVAYNEYSFEAPHGVGYLVSHIDVS